MPEGVYLEVYHGRKDPNEQMDDWGEMGAVIGCFRFVVTTYGTHVRGIKADGEVCNFYVVSDLLYYDGMYYGDWSVISAEQVERMPSLLERREEYDKEKAIPPEPDEDPLLPPPSQAAAISDEMREQLDDIHFNVNLLEELGGRYELDKKVLRVCFEPQTPLQNLAEAAAEFVILSNDLFTIKPNIETNNHTGAIIMSHERTLLGI